MTLFIGEVLDLSKIPRLLRRSNLPSNRDIKMQNLLFTGKGVLKIGTDPITLPSLDVIKISIADFGMAREYSPRPLTPGVVTIWYEFLHGI